MPNAVTYSDEKTNTKALRALFGNNDLDFEQALAAVERLQAAGILFREEVPEELKSVRKPREAGTVPTEADLLAAGDQADANVVIPPVQ